MMHVHVNHYALSTPSKSPHLSPPSLPLFSHHLFLAHSIYMQLHIAMCTWSTSEYEVMEMHFVTNLYMFTIIVIPL